MEYKLAKKLKNAGFPFNYINDPRQIADVEFEDGSFVLFPTLSELIKACNCQCFNLDKRAKWASGGQWFCMGSILKEGQEDKLRVNPNKMPELAKRGFGDTPEEAVANLWMNLNKMDS